MAYGKKSALGFTVFFYTSCAFFYDLVYDLLLILRKLIILCIFIVFFMFLVLGFIEPLGTSFIKCDTFLLLFFKNTFIYQVPYFSLETNFSYFRPLEAVPQLTYALILFHFSHCVSFCVVSILMPSNFYIFTFVYVLFDINPINIYF